MILLYVNSYTSKNMHVLSTHQYTSLYIVYESPHIRISAYTSLLLYESPPHPGNASHVKNTSLIVRRKTFITVTLVVIKLFSSSTAKVKIS